MHATKTSFSCNANLRFFIEDSNNCENSVGDAFEISNLLLNQIALKPPNVRYCCCKAFAAFQAGSRAVMISENKFHCDSNRCSAALEAAIFWQKSFKNSSRWSISHAECQGVTQSKLGFFRFNFFKIIIISGDLISSVRILNKETVTKIYLIKI